jgi:hypothetical protein
MINLMMMKWREKMANPIAVNCAAGAYTKVATGVTTGRVHVQTEVAQSFKVTHRNSGDSAPTNDVLSYKLLVPDDQVGSSDPIDVYVKPLSRDAIILFMG